MDRRICVCTTGPVTTRKNIIDILLRYSLQQADRPIGPHRIAAQSHQRLALIPGLASSLALCSLLHAAERYARR